jgi:hypothetical protein
VAEDLIYEFRFSTETRPALGAITGPIPFIGNPNIGNAALQGISKLDGAGSEGITRRQTYTVTEVRGKRRTPLFKGQKLVAVPSNVGPFTIPNYEDLASQGVYEDGNFRVFAGQRAETFYIDLGAVFDTVNLRRPVPALTQAEDADDSVDPFGINRFSGFNIHTIAIELPISRLTSFFRQDLARDALRTEQGPGQDEIAAATALPPGELKEVRPGNAAVRRQRRDERQAFGTAEEGGNRIADGGRRRQHRLTDLLPQQILDSLDARRPIDIVAAGFPRPHTESQSTEQNHREQRHQADGDEHLNECKSSFVLRNAARSHS